MEVEEGLDEQEVIQFEEQDDQGLVINCDTTAEVITLFI